MFQKKPFMKNVFFLIDASKLCQSFSGVELNIEGALSKASQEKAGPMKVAKTVWTSNLEAVLEYVRIVSDVFRKERQVHCLFCTQRRLFEPPTKEHMSVSEWKTYFYEMSKIAMKSIDSFDITAASEYLSKYVLSCLKSTSHVQDIGIVIINNSSSNVSADQLTFDEMRSSLNANLHITCLQLIEIGNPPISPLEKQEVSSGIFFECQSSYSGKPMTTSIIQLAIQHHDLFISSVSGIPMKEEQGTGKSMNYDVEIIHSASVYEPLLKYSSHDVINTINRDNLKLKMVYLNWNSAKPAAADFSVSSITSRCSKVTLLDVNAKPSVCLSTFVLGGKCAHFDIKTKEEIPLQYFLGAINGDILLQCSMNQPYRHQCDDSYQIVEGAGGKVSDYRYQPIKCVLLASYLSYPKPGSDENLESATRALKTYTSCFPLTFSESSAACVPLLENLMRTLTNNVQPFDEDEMIEAKTTIDALVDMERAGKPLYLGLSSQRNSSKNDLRSRPVDQAYQHLFCELKSFIGVAAKLRPQNKELYDHLISVRPSLETAKPPSISKPEVLPFTNTATAYSTSATQLTHKIELKPSGESLLTLCSRAASAAATRKRKSTPCLEFRGRQTHGGDDDVFPLYAHLEDRSISDVAPLPTSKTPQATAPKAIPT